MRAVWLLSTMALLTGCGDPPSPASLFPLEPGRHWTFDVRTEWETLAIEHETRELSTEGEAEVGGVTAWRRRSADSCC